MRALLDERVAMAKSEAEKIAAFPVLQAAASNLSKMVETLNKLERTTDVVLGKDALDRLLDEIVEILVSELSNVEDSESIIDRVASRIGGALAESHNRE